MPVIVNCDWCGKEIRRTPNAVSARNFCCHAHRNYVTSRGPANGRWRGGSYVQAGYRFVQTEDGYVQEHRLVMEAKLGRKLRPEERVNHKDDDKLNNDPANLELMANQSEHVRAHDRRNHPTRGLPVWAWEQRGGGCADCHGTARPHYGHGLCERCYQRRKAARRKLSTL